MVTVLPEVGSSSEVLAEDIPSESGNPELVSLTTALRMSIAGEEMDTSTSDLEQATARAVDPPRGLCVYL